MEYHQLLKRLNSREESQIDGTAKFILRLRN